MARRCPLRVTLLLLLLGLLLLLSRGAGDDPPPRQVRWWSSHIDDTLDMAYAHRDSITGVYPCCDGPSTLPNGTFQGGGLPCDASGRATGSWPWVDALQPLGLTVENAAYANGAALQSGAADLAIPAFVHCAVELNLTGYMFDTETMDGGGTAEQQAVIYSRWLGKLSTAMRAAGKTVGVTLSDWGLLSTQAYSSLYAKAGVDHVMTMATYYNMAPASTDCSLCPAPIKSWTDRSQLWSFWLKLPQQKGLLPGAMGAGVGQTTAQGCGCANGTRGCCDGIGGTTVHGLTDKLQAARKYDGCSALGCPGGHCDFSIEMAAFLECFPIEKAAISIEIRSKPMFHGRSHNIAFVCNENAAMSLQQASASSGPSLTCTTSSSGQAAALALSPTSTSGGQTSTASTVTAARPPTSFRSSPHS